MLLPPTVDELYKVWQTGCADASFEPGRLEAVSLELVHALADVLRARDSGDIGRVPPVVQAGIVCGAVLYVPENVASKTPEKLVSKTDVARDWLRGVFERWLFPAKRRQDNRSFGVPTEGLEDVTVKHLQDAHVVADALETGAIKLNVYTPVISSLGNAFECELNASLVQWARQRVGVKMPAYYGRYQPGVEARVVPSIPNGEAVDLNAKRDGEWLPPGMGRSRLVVKDLAASAPPSPWSTENWARTLSTWKKLQELRNSAAHGALLGADDLAAARASLGELVACGAFSGMVTLKATLRGSNC